MKVKISVLALTLILILGLSSSNVQAVSTPQYLGQTQWLVNITQTNQGPTDLSFPVNGGITKLGDNFYLFQGYVTETGGDNPFFLSGGGTLINDQLIMTLSTSQKHLTDPQDQSVWRDTGVMQVTLNATHSSQPDTYLCGSLYEIGHDYNAAVGQSAFDQRYTAGTLTLTGPQIPLNSSAGAGALSLLLQE